MTHGEQNPGTGEAAARRQEMLDTLVGAITDEDYDFSTEVASEQRFLRPFEIAEYMDVKRRHSEDPVESRRWEDALRNYLDSLDEEFPPEEAEVINGIVNSLEFDSITTNDSTADEAYDIDADDEEEDDPQNEDEDDDTNWDNDKFYIQIEKERLDRIAELPVFKQTLQYALGNSWSDPNLGKAVNHILEHVAGELASEMRVVLDWYIFKQAEQKAIGTTFSDPSLQAAHKVIDDFGSGDEPKAAMKKNLDRYVFQQAHEYMLGNSWSDPRPTKAKEHIVTYASSPARRDAMLRQLGFM